MGKFSQLKRLDGHPYYFQNPLNQKISYIKGSVRIHTGVTSIKEARKIADEELIKRFSTNPKAEKRKRRGISNPLVSELWADLMEQRAPGSEISTAKGYQSSWKKGIEPFWGEKTVGEINPHNISQWENWNLKVYPTRVFFNTRKHFVMLLNYLKKQGLINEVYEVKRLDEVIIKRTKKKKVGRVYEDSEISAILENVSDLRTKLGVLIYRYMGPRKTEVLKSKRVDWDLEKDTVNLWSYKNHNWRTIYIPSIVKPVLTQWIEETKEIESEYLFPSDKDPKKHTSSQVFDRKWTKAKELAGIKDWNVKGAARIHDLRHTFATWTRKAGWDIIAACAWLDMSAEEYQRTYCHVTSKDLAELMKKSVGSM